MKLTSILQHIITEQTIKTHYGIGYIVATNYTLKTPVNGIWYSKSFARKDTKHKLNAGVTVDAIVKLRGGKYVAYSKLTGKNGLPVNSSSEIYTTEYDGKTAQWESLPYEPINPKNKELIDFKNKLKQLDWYYEKSDDSRVYKKGKLQYDALVKKYNSLISNYDEDAIKKVWNKYAPKNFQKK